MRSLAHFTVAAATLLALGASDRLDAQLPGPLSCANPDLSYRTGESAPGLVSHTGNAVEPVSGRQFFLDYPCDLEPGEEVIFIFNLHGGGSLGNWQRHYFPIYHYKDEYNLVVATPDAGDPGAGTWNPERDDAYLEGVVSYVYETFADYDITFWFAGHSFGGSTTRRLICTPFYQAKNPVGFVSLSGGRVGSARAGRGGQVAALPECDFSHIFTVGQHEASGGSLDERSLLAEKYNCGAPVRQRDVIDTRPGLVYDSGRQDPGTQSWGFLPRPGVTEWQVFPNCAGGRVVADLIRIDKGHTEGLEENVVEQIVQLIVSAPR